MFIAHIPSAYLLAKAITAQCKQFGLSARDIIVVAVIGTIFPDIDLLYFYFVDDRQHHHHSYPTHWPLTWLALLILATLLCRQASAKKSAAILGIFGMAALLHLLLDSVVGDVWWLAPWVDQSFSLFTLEAIYQPWWLNFLLHWSFAVELLICLAAACVFIQQRRKRLQRHQRLHR